MPVAGGPNITKTGILLEVDAADRLSYPGTGTTWINPVSPGTFNGTLNNISFDPNDSRGALVFTGSNTFVDFGNVGPLTSSFSFQVAFKPAATASGEPYTILSYASASATSSITFKLDYTSSNQTVVLTAFSTGSGAARAVHAISASALTGSWNIVHGTYGSSLAALYVNGLGQAYVDTTGSAVGYNASNRLYVGASFGLTSSFYTGSIANISVNNADLDGLSVNKNYNAFASRFSLPVRRPLVTDADAFAFVEVASIADPTQQSAINTLVLGLKSNNLWTKMQAIYPFIGGTAYSHKFNLKNPGNTDNAFRIQYIGAINHSSLGVQQAGGHLETYWNPSDALFPTESIHISVNNYTTASVGSIHNNEFGNTFQTQIYFSPTYGSATSNVNFALKNNGATSISNNSGQGYFVLSRLDTTKSTGYIYRSNSLFSSADNTNSYLTTSDVSVTLLNNLGHQAYGGIVNFFTIGAGLTAAETSTLYSIVQTYQTALSRNT